MPQFPVLKPEHIAGILFDVGGVLMVPAKHAAEEGVITDAFGRYFQQTFVDEYHRRDGNHPWHDLETGRMNEERFFEALVLSFQDETGLVISPAHARSAVWGTGLEVHLPMLDLVGELRTLGMKTGILSNAGRGSLDHVTQFHNDELFDAVIISGEFGVRKPNPEIYLIAAKMLSLEPTAMLFIDDIFHNVTAAHELGFQTILCEDPDVTVFHLRTIFQLLPQHEAT